MKEQINLKPCPFCGSEAEIRAYTATTQFVQCIKCNAGTTACETSEEACLLWNKRNTLLVRLRKVVRTWLNKWLKD